MNTEKCNVLAYRNLCKRTNQLKLLENKMSHCTSLVMKEYKCLDPTLYCRTYT